MFWVWINNARSIWDKVWGLGIMKGYAMELWDWNHMHIGAISIKAFKVQQARYAYPLSNISAGCNYPPVRTPLAQTIWTYDVNVCTYGYKLIRQQKRRREKVMGMQTAIQVDVQG